MSNGNTGLGILGSAGGLNEDPELRSLAKEVADKIYMTRAEMIHGKPPPGFEGAVTPLGMWAMLFTANTRGEPQWYQVTAVSNPKNSDSEDEKWALATTMIVALVADKVGMEFVRNPETGMDRHGDVSILVETWTIYPEGRNPLAERYR